MGYTVEQEEVKPLLNFIRDFSINSGSGVIGPYLFRYDSYKPFRPFLVSLEVRPQFHCILGTSKVKMTYFMKLKVRIWKLWSIESTDQGVLKVLQKSSPIA